MMQYRTLGRTGIRVSEIGMGCEGMLEKPYETVSEFVSAMERLGVNCIDLYAPNPEFRAHLGRALEGRREKFVLQAHIGSIWQNGQYKRTRDIGEVREGFQEQLRLLRTDYADVGMIHYVDSLSDWEKIANGPVLAQAQGFVPETVREHYAVLPHKAGECIQCGACETRCPFGVEIRQNMRKAADIFGA